MSNKQIIKDVFEREYNKDKMKAQILNNYSKSKKSGITRIVRFALPVCLVMIFAVFLMYNKNEELPTVKIGDNNLVINKLDNIGAYKFDADIKEIPTKGIDKLNNIMLPSDLTNFDNYSVYTRETKDGEYNVLNSNVYRYYNEEDNRNIRIAFSENYKPIRDYYFDDEGASNSKINNIEIKVFSYNEVYFTVFNYNGYNFDVETSGIDIYEFENLLSSILGN